MEMPKGYEGFSEARREGFIKVKEAKENGKKIVGVFCTYTPWEVLHAGGSIPVSVCGVSEEPIVDAEKHLPKNFCPLIKSSYGFAITDKCPYMYFSDLIVGETTCDGKKKMFELLGRIKNTHVMELPQSSEGEDNYNLWKNEMLRLKERVEKDFEVTITDDMLRESIKLRNEERKLLQEFYSLGKLTPPPMWGYEMQKVLEGANFTFDKKEQNQKIKDMIEDIKKKYDEGHRPVDKSLPRILITGCPSGGVADKVIKTIEESGAVVVCYENCGGVKEKMTLVREDINPIDALTEKYLKIPCSVMSPNTGRIDLLGNLIDEYTVDGVIDITLQACHTYATEAFTVREFVNDVKGIPYMNLETNYSPSDTGQIKTRVEAFIEML